MAVSTQHQPDVSSALADDVDRLSLELETAKLGEETPEHADSKCPRGTAKQCSGINRRVVAKFINKKNAYLLAFTRRTPAATTFALPELLENILLHLSTKDVVRQS